ncbi:ATP-binding cassette domain-containing protein [Bariatricus sp. SGI.154]|uniref:ATP-binding cassette domain-containing protein n=1 Tax=Bariatricus sp. SGI.154 TaxID=3420549 RepID=UPI003D027191
MAVPGGKNARIDGKEKARVLMKQCGIEALENKMPYELSGGERQRTAICRALIHDPQIIFADEQFRWCCGK